MIPENPATPIYELIVDARSNASDQDPFGAVQRAAVQMGSSVTLRCQALFNAMMSSSKKNIFWGFRGNTLHPSIGKSSLHVEDDRLTSTLEITEFEKRHQGSFECFFSVNESITAIAAINLSPQLEPKPNMSSSELEECSSDHFSCLNGGACYKHVKTDQMFCRCYPDYGGPNCEHYMPRIVNGAAKTHKCDIGKLDMNACLIVGTILGFIVVLLLALIFYFMKRKNLIRDGIWKPMRKGISVASLSSSEYFKTSLRRRTSQRLTECTCTPSEENLAIMEGWHQPGGSHDHRPPPYFKTALPLPEPFTPSGNSIQSFVFQPNEIQCFFNSPVTSDTAVTLSQSALSRSNHSQPIIDTTIVVANYSQIPSSDSGHSLNEICFVKHPLIPVNQTAESKSNFGILRVATDRRLTFSERSHRASECAQSITSSIDC